MSAERAPDDGWRLLLAAFADDEASAARAYEAMRARLIDLFRWKGLGNAEELADRAFDRAARRLADGAHIERGIAAYLTGIARKLVLEASRADARIVALPDEVPAAADAPDPQADACLEDCLAEQPPAARALLLRYLADRGRTRIQARARLAAELGINTNALRIRVHRVRAAVEACLRACLGRNVSRPEATSRERT